MEKITIKIILLTLAITLAGCSSSEDIKKVPDSSAQALYSNARKALDNGLFQKAVQILSAIDSRFPFGPISHQVQLDLIYAYYKSGDFAQGTALADRFIRLNPNHQDLDYVYYIRGLIHQSTEDNLFQNMLGIDRSDRDPTASHEAFDDFNHILDNYPQSKYAADAKKRMIAIKNRLAKYELKVAQFYFDRQAYAASANRGRYIIKYFPTNKEVEQALEIMIKSYGKMGLDDLKTNALRVLAVNYPTNDLVK